VLAQSIVNHDDRANRAYQLARQHHLYRPLAEEMRRFRQAVDRCWEKLVALDYDQTIDKASFKVLRRSLIALAEQIIIVSYLACLTEESYKSDVVTRRTSEVTKRT
jgi:hypothetical protein